LLKLLRLFGLNQTCCLILNLDSDGS
jgi:hypothetical protein